MKKHEIRELFILGGKGSGHFGHKGIPGHQGGSASSKSGIPARPDTFDPDELDAWEDKMREAAGPVISEAVEFVKTLTLSGGTRQGLDISPEAFEFLQQTVDKKSYTLYRGTSVVKGRLSDDQMVALRKLRPGDPVPNYLAKMWNPYASYTAKKSVANYYAQGKISVVAKSKVAGSDVVVDTRNLRKVLSGIGFQDLFSSGDYEYFKDDAEVIVKEPILGTIASIK